MDFHIGNLYLTEDADGLPVVSAVFHSLPEGASAEDSGFNVDLDSLPQTVQDRCEALRAAIRKPVVSDREAGYDAGWDDAADGRNREYGKFYETEKSVDWLIGWLNGWDAHAEGPDEDYDPETDGDNGVSVAGSEFDAGYEQGASDASEDLPRETVEDHEADESGEWLDGYVAGWDKFQEGPTDVR